MKPSSKFFVTIPVKPYVKRYLENNYGSPVNFEEHPLEKTFFRNIFKNPRTRWDNKYPEELKKHKEFVEVLISKDDFMRHGFKLTKTRVIEFNRRFELEIKKKVRGYVQLKKGFSSLKESILDFQKLYNIDDDSWDYESIKKDITRHAVKPEIDFRELLNNLFDELHLKSSIPKEKKKKIKENEDHYVI